MAQSYEINFDGLVGTTHHYGGLSYGNMASMSHAAQASNPRQAALQGLQKMKFLADLGIKQAVLPPQQRPDFGALRRLGFEGTESEILDKVARASPDLLSAVYSASSMWTANAATVSPSADTSDHKVHFTPANLCSKFHRSLEPEQTGRILKAIFQDPQHFLHHDPVPSGPYLGDEGAANHTRFCEEYGGPGLELFVFGKYGFRKNTISPQHFPARQTYEASEAVARLHRLREGSAHFVQQNAEAIDAGAFHNDVVSVGNRNVFFVHESALLDQHHALNELRARYRAACGADLKVIEVPSKQVSLEDAVRSYLFNSQLVSLPDGSMALVAPTECEERPAVQAYLKGLVESANSPIRLVHFLNLRESMRNGGGPACLRLRVVLNTAELRASNPGVYLDETLYPKLKSWIERNYRERLLADDLRDPALVRENRAALDELTQILSLGSVYPFQM